MSRYDWGQTHPGISRLEQAVDAARTRVVTHPLYAHLDSHPAIVTFLEHHVCGDDDTRWQQCAETVNLALAARCRLWDGILAAIKARAE